LFGKKEEKKLNSSLDVNSDDYVGYFLGLITQELAEKILKGNGFNSFLIRNTPQQGKYFLSKFDVDSNIMEHIDIETTNTGKYKFKFSIIEYDTLESLIKVDLLQGFKPAFEEDDDEPPINDDNYKKINSNLKKISSDYIYFGDYF